LSVQALDSSALWEAGGQSGGTELGGTATWGEDTADRDILDELGVDAGALDEVDKGAVEEIGACSVLETTLAALGEGSSKSGGDDNVVGVLLEQARAAGV